ncbi:MAG: sugar phosphate isomerase/epimerase family protein [Aggregatilineales bacterium]
MADRVLFCSSLRTFDECLKLACQYGVGMEIQAFAYPDILDGNWQSLLTDYKRALVPLPGERAMHGPFIDMASASPDRLIRDVVRQRVFQALEIAAQLNVTTIVFHANFIASIRNEHYRREWIGYQIDFWTPMAERAAGMGITLALENMWEFDPHIIGDLLRAVNLPNLRACLDVGHASLFSDVPLDNWLSVMAPYLAHTHLNNNLGQIDEHRAFDDGVIDYHLVLPMLRALPHPPAMSLEITDIAAIRRSLPFLQLPQPVHLD